MKWGFDIGEEIRRETRRGTMLDGVGGRAPRLLARVSEMMTAPAIAADPLSTVGRAQGIADRHGFCHLPVAWGDGEIVGIVCVCDLWSARPHELVIQHMTLPVITISARDTVMRAADVARDHDVGCLPVVDEQRRLCGIITEGDLLRVGAIGVDHLPPACIACGSRHHVRPGLSIRGGRASASYCLRCLARPNGIPANDAS
jgi:CBS domain-containing protein